MSVYIDTIRLMIADSSENQAEIICNLLRNAGYGVRLTLIQDLDQFKHDLNEHPWDLIISEENIGDLRAEELLNILKEQEKVIPFILLTEEYASYKVTQGLKKGVDAVVDAEDMEQLLLIINQLIHLLSIRREHDILLKQQKEVERRCELLLETSRDAIAYIHDGLHIYANPAYIRLFGYKDIDAIVETTILDLISPTQVNSFKEYLTKHTKEKKPAEDFAFKAKRHDGSEFNAHLFLSPAIYHEEHCTQAIVRLHKLDQETTKQTRELSEKDLLTGLISRQHFTKKTETLLNSGLKQAALFYIKINDFSKIKQDIGLSAADVVISDAGQLLKSIIQPGMILAHYSDDAFTLLSANMNKDHARKMGQLIYLKFKEAITECQNNSINLSCCIGISLLNNDNKNVENLITEAYQANHKTTSNDPIYLYQLPNNKPMHSEGLIQDIKNALQAGRFKLLFQPIINIKDGSEPVYEVQVQLANEKNELVDPKQLFPAAESAGLADKIDRWMIMHAIKMLHERRLQGEKTSLFLRLYAGTLIDTELVSWISAALNEAKLPSDALTFEINCEHAAQYLAPCKILVRGLRELHCHVALTHFKGDEKDFATLHHLKTDFVKLADHFASDISRKGDLQKISERLQALVKKLQEQKMTVVIPNVEEAITVPTLWQSGANYLQGGFLAPLSEKMNFQFSGG